MAAHIVRGLLVKKSLRPFKYTDATEIVSMSLLLQSFHIIVMFLCNIKVPKHNVHFVCCSVLYLTSTMVIN